VANEKNLIPWNKRTESEQREYARQGGKKSGEVRRQRKVMKEQMEMMLALPFVLKEETEFMKLLGIDKDNIDNQMALLVALYKKGLNGDVQAIQEIRKIVGDEQTVNEDDRVQIINDLPKDEDND